MKALLVIDVQNDFLPGGSLEVKDSDKIIPVINKIQKNFPLVIASQDFHPRGHMSFASSHQGKNPFEVIDYKNIKQTLWPDHCVQGTFGAEFSDKLTTTSFEVIVRKGTDLHIDSYSTFYDNKKIKNTGLNGYLKEKNVTEIYFTGIAADICVYYSVKDALDLGFKCFVVEDAVSPLNIEEYLKQKVELSEKGVVYIGSEEV